MLIKDLSNNGPEDITIAEKLSFGGDCITEATARVLRFNYERAKNDPKPRILALGRWNHPNTNSKLVVGINLNYLNDKEVEMVKENLPEIMKHDKLKTRWWAGYALLPSIWAKAYRQYDEKYIHSVNAAEFGAEPIDYETPKQPSQLQDKEKIGAKPAAEIGSIKKIEAQKKQEPPKEPQKKRGLVRLAGDTIKRIADLIKGKLFKNRKKASEKQELGNVEKIDQEKELEGQRDLEQQQLKKNEEEKEAERELEKLSDLEDIQGKEKVESRLKNLNSLVESVNKPKKLVWKNTDQYIYWHEPNNFVEHQERLKGSILDHSNGTKLVAVHNIATGQVVIDLVESIEEVLANTGWTCNHTVRIMYDKELIVECDDMGDTIFGSEVAPSEIWNIIQAVSETDFQ